MKKLSVVIPVYGQWDLAKRNIDSLLEHERSNVLEIIVVDDCSPELNPYLFDESLVKVIRNSINLGYSGTVNNGLRLASSEIVILFDSDAYLISPITPKLLTVFDNNRQLGCLGFTSIGTHGQRTGSFQLEPTLSGFIMGQSLEATLHKLFTSKKSKIIPFSCCVAFRKDCLEDVNYFDDITFPQVEADVDLGLRIHQSKWKVEVTEEIVISHQGGNSYKINSKRVRLYHRGKWNLFRKHQVIKNPTLIKSLLHLRIWAEIIVMKNLELLHYKRMDIREKLAGRKQLLKDLGEYT